jgi:hypothetical protein
MRRRNDPRKDELDGVAQRLRDARPQADPLELDRIKTTAMSRAKAAVGGGRAGARRLAVAGMTVGLMAAGTGGVIAGVDTGKGHGNAATAQYGNNCDTHNNNGNNNGNEGGNENNNGNNNFNCNNNSFNGSGNTTTNITNNITNSTVTVSATPPPASGVLGSTSTKAATSKRHFTIHINVPRKARLRKVTIKVNGKVISVLRGNKAKASISLTNLPCSKGATTVVIIAVTDSGKTIKESRQFHLCQA